MVSEGQETPGPKATGLSPSWECAGRPGPLWDDIRAKRPRPGHKPPGPHLGTFRPGGLPAEPRRPALLTRPWSHRPEMGVGGARGVTGTYLLGEGPGS